MQKDYLSDQETIEIEKFYNNEIMREAVRKVLLEDLYSNGVLTPGVPANPAKNAAYYSVASGRVDISNEQAGATLRAMWQGINSLEVAFGKLKEIKPKQEEVITKKVNKAR